MIDTTQIEATASRYRQREKARARNKRLISEGRPLAADSPERVEKFLVRRGFGKDEVTALVRQSPRGSPAARRRGPLALERVLGTNDLMGVAFLERGLQVARSVGRIWIGVAGGNPEGYGTGFLVSPRLLMTNHHVLGDQGVARKSLVEFDYQVGLSGVILPTTTFAFDPDEFFFADKDLDYALVAVRSTGNGGRSLADFGWNPLIEEEGKAIVSQWLNLIQHPNGETKQLGLRENQLLDVLDEFLHYETDTAPGSSGSPVYNDRWEVVALHHSGVWATNDAGQPLATDGGVWREDMGEHRIKWIANEGARISKIVAHLRRQAMTAPQLRLFEETFAASPAATDEGASRGRTLPHPATPQSAQATVAADGTATWIIPLTVSVRLGGIGTPSPSPSEPAPSNVAQPVGPQVPVAAGGEDQILEAAGRELGSRADVLDVDLGYVFEDGWITDTRALVVTVRRKLALAGLREASVPPLPKTFMGLPVEVINPSVEDVVRQVRGPAVAEEAFSDLATLPEEIMYTPPERAPLDEVRGEMRVIAHVSPDAGWPQLSDFLKGVRERLVVGMYDFGAPHVLDSVRDASDGASFEKLTLVMQKGESVGTGTKADDLRDDEVVGRLEDLLGSKFENAWVRIGSVNGWVSSSYHIKVAVRDREAFWLSSGNWQSSNQPKAEPLNEEPQKREWLERYNREWHAIVEHEALAEVFEAHLLHDYENNVGAEGREELDLPDLLVPESFFVPSAERATRFRYFEPFEARRVFSVRPLLTPDNYHEHVLDLIEGAQEELLIQNQTFNAPKADHDKLRELIEAVLAKQRAGVEVRVIFRLHDFAITDVRRNLEALKERGFDMDDFKVQRNCHTKGIVVDRKKVLLGSQNWSNDGVSVNRDASLLFDDEELARYFADIFDHDWAILAAQDIGPEPTPIESAVAGGTTPPGMVRLSWKDYMEMR